MDTINELELNRILNNHKKLVNELAELIQELKEPQSIDVDMSWGFDEFENDDITIDEVEDEPKKQYPKINKMDVDWHLLYQIRFWKLVFQLNPQLKNDDNLHYREYKKNQKKLINSLLQEFIQNNREMDEILRVRLDNKIIH